MLKNEEINQPLQKRYRDKFYQQSIPLELPIQSLEIKILIFLLQTLKECNYLK